MGRTCVSCVDPGVLSFYGLRSWTSGIDYLLGNGRILQPGPAPGRECVEANDLALPIVLPLLDAGGDAIGATANWKIARGGDDLEVIVLARAHGEDWIGAHVEFTLLVINHGTVDARIGVRHLFAPEIGGVPTPTHPFPGSLTRFDVSLRPEDPPTEPPLLVESEFAHPAWRMWQVAPDWNPDPATDPQPYAVAGAMTGPVTLEPPPTPPDFLQFAWLDAWSPTGGPGPVPGGGVGDDCFVWHAVPAPRELRPARGGVSVVTAWGLDETDALVVPPGGEIAVTQHYVAFIDYPLSTEIDGPFEIDCDGTSTRVPISGRAVTTEPTSAMLHHRWSSSDPRVQFVDPAAPVTEAIVDGAGSFPVRLTTAVGAYESASDSMIVVRDIEFPRFIRLEASPTALWPPNHRLVDVHVDVVVQDNCDEAPSIRLVAARSSERRSPPQRGAGHADPDIVGAELGTDDRDVSLRAERAGSGPGREYTLTYEVTDGSGNATRQDVIVTVGHDQRRRR